MTAEKSPAPATAQAAAPAPPPDATPAPHDPAPPTTSSPAPPPATPSAVPAADRLTIGLSARRPCWVSATVDGQKAIERLLQTGEQTTLEVRREMVLTAGDASAITLTLNGADARALGKAGEVVTTRLNLSNYKDYLQSR